VIDEVFPVDLPAVERAKAIVQGHRALSSCTALHLAVMERHGIRQILTFDTAFDTYPGVSRLRH
jgi:predicted nucleic acid-binding protein